MRFLRQLRAALWSFVGVRRSTDSTRDLEGASPATTIAAGLVIAAVLVAAIVFLARTLVGGAARREPAPSASSQVQAPAAAFVPRHAGPVLVADQGLALELGGRRLQFESSGHLSH